MKENVATLGTDRNLAGVRRECASQSVFIIADGSVSLIGIEQQGIDNRCF